LGVFHFHLSWLLEHMKKLNSSLFAVAAIALLPACINTACPDMEFEGLHSADKIQIIHRRLNRLDNPVIREIKNSEEIRDLADFAVQHQSDWYRDIYGDPRYPEEWIYINFYQGSTALGGFGLVSDYPDLIAESHCLGSFPRYRGISRTANDRLKSLVEGN